MEVLPIKAIREEDGPIIGNNLLNLAKLSQHNFPVADGIIVTPPDLKFRTILEHFQFKDRDVFEQSLQLIKSKILEIPVPAEVESCVSKKGIDPKKVWINLLDGWFSQIRSKIWREGFSPKLTSALIVEPVFFTRNIKASGDVYFDYDQKLAIIKTYTGKLTPDLILELEDLIKQANKKLFLPQVYQWIIDGDVKKTGKLFFVKVTPFTGELPKIKTNFDYPAPIYTEKTAEEKMAKSSMRVFLEMGDDLKISHDVDGILIKAEAVTDMDKKILQLVEAGITLPKAPIIFKLPDIKEGFGGVRGTLKLIHGGQILRQEVAAVLFARNKKELLNIAVAVPFVRSVRELLQIKRDLAVLGISRKGSLKLWLEIATPENILNIEDYLTTGFDGALINLDELAAWIGGFNPEEPESIFYQKQVTALLKFLSDGLKILHKAGIPILASGSLVLHDDILAFLISAGVWGVSLSSANIVGMHEYLRFVEKRHIRGRAADWSA